MRRWVRLWWWLRGLRWLVDSPGCRRRRRLSRRRLLAVDGCRLGLGLLLRELRGAVSPSTAPWKPPSLLRDLPNSPASPLVRFASGSPAIGTATAYGALYKHGRNAKDRREHQQAQGKRRPNKG